MTINIHTDEQVEDRVPALHVQTLKDLSPRDDHQIRGGYRGRSTSDGFSCD